MTPALQNHAPPAATHADEDCHILIVTRDVSTRFAVANLLLEAGFCVTTAATFGVVEILLENGDMFDLMVTAQSAEEITQFGVPQLARSIDPDMPILVLEIGTAHSPAIVDLVNGTLSRWPLRDRKGLALH